MQPVNTWANQNRQSTRELRLSVGYEQLARAKPFLRCICTGEECEIKTETGKGGQKNFLNQQQTSRSKSLWLLDRREPPEKLFSTVLYDGPVSIYASIQRGASKCDTTINFNLLASADGSQTMQTQFKVWGPLAGPAGDIRGPAPHVYCLRKHQKCVEKTQRPFSHQNNILRYSNGTVQSWVHSRTLDFIMFTIRMKTSLQLILTTDRVSAWIYWSSFTILHQGNAPLLRIIIGQRIKI